MEIYYRKVTVFCKYPWQSEVDHRYVEYSKSRKKFIPFAKTGVELTMNERLQLIAKELNMNPNKIKLVKI